MKKERRKEIKIYKRRRYLKRIQAARRFILNALPKDERTFQSGKLNDVFSRLVTLQVPVVFDTNKSLNDVLNFISKCKALSTQNSRVVNINFGKAKDVNAGALSLLLSVIQDLGDLNIQIRGNMPNEPLARKEFADSGFLEFVHNEQGLKMNSTNKIIVKGQHKVDQKRTGLEIKKAMKTVTGSERHNPPLQGALIEMMANSLNHAFPEMGEDNSKFYAPFSQNKRWYFSAFHHRENKEVHFSFIDNGIGILKTIRRGPFKAFVEKVSDVDVLKDAFNGKYRSSTDLKERGKGLPTVKRALELNAINGLKIVTNNQLYDFETQEHRKLTNGFEGTCYFWKVDINCKYGKDKD